MLLAGYRIPGRSGGAVSPPRGLHGWPVPRKEGKSRERIGSGAQLQHRVDVLPRLRASRVDDVDGKIWAGGRRASRGCRGRLYDGQHDKFLADAWILLQIMLAHCV